MIPLYEDPHCTFRFGDDRIVPRFHLEGVEAICLFFFTAGSPVGLAWGLAHVFAARKRYHEDWASLQIE